MAELSVQKVSIIGLDPSFVAADVAGDTAVNDGKTFIHVKNGSASSINVTIDSFEQCNHGFDHDLIISVPASDEKIIGPFQTKRFNQDGKINLSYSAVTSVTVAAFRL